MAESAPGVAAYLGTARIPDRSAHAVYNDWHQLDHLPENLALDGVRWGERWVRTPACVDASLVAEEEWSEFDYLTNYWFRDPITESVDAWTGLADESFHWGRRPDIGITERSFLSFFRPVWGIASPRVAIGASVLPIRPNKGLYLTVSQLAPTAGAERGALERRFEWYRTVGFPAMIERPGVAGVWALTSAHDLAPDSWAAQESSTAGSMPLVRAHIHYLDTDPVGFAEGVTADQVLAPGTGDDEGIERLVFAGPLEAITPYQWNWFD